MKRMFFAILCLACSGAAAAQSENAWSSQDYDFYAGDFNGDGKTDVLFVGRDPSLPSGVLLSDGNAPTILGQTWASNYLGIPWSAGMYTVVVGDFNGDGKSDIFLQSVTPGDSYLLLTDASGTVSGISQTVPSTAMGLGWTGDQHHLVAGDFTGSGRAGLYLQPVDPGGVSAIVLTDTHGQFTASAPAQVWADGFLGLSWAVSEANVFAGDFNGDGQADLLVQAMPASLSGNGTVFQSYPNMSGVAFAQPGAQSFAAGNVQTWDHNGFGVDWSPFSNQLVVADFNGDGRADVLFQPIDSGGSAALLMGNVPGPIFTAFNGPLPSDVPISADAAVLVPGNFSGGATAGLLIQSTSRNGTTSIAKNISKGIHPTGVALPHLTASSVAVVAGGAPQSGSLAPSAGVIASPLAATIAPTSAGRTAAQFSVTPTGAASYNIPLWTPPGARGIEPHLALHYTSGGPDGPMGPGWSLTGMSAIARCGKTWVSSGGAPAGVTLTTADDICLDGNRLIKTGGTQLVAGSTYQTEIADFSNVTAYGSQGNGPQYFIVQGKDGRYYEYGNTADSRIFSSGITTPYMWALSKVRDHQGNNLTLTYSAGATALTVTKILYTATPGSSNAAPYEVDFSYVTRVGGTVISQFVGGGSVTRSTQLDNVTVQSLQTPIGIVRKYQLGYSASAATNRPLLQTLQECGGSAGTDCIRATTINYSAGAPGWSTTASSLGVTIPTNAQVFPVDLNGDGFADMVYPTLSGSTYTWYVRYGSGSGTFGTAVALGITTATSDAVFPADLAARGHPDLIYPAGGFWRRLFWNGSSLTTASTGVPVVAKVTPSGAADVNGDGLPDLIFADNSDDSFSNITVARNTTTSGTVSFAAATVWYQFPMNVSCLDNTPCNEFHVAGVPYTGTAVIQVADFNGDGRADVLVQANHKTKNGTTYLWEELVSTGSSFTLLSSADAAAYSLRPQLTDWNGDGCTDYVDPGVSLGSTWTIRLSPCAASPGTFISTTIPSSQPTVLVDYDGDGRIDLMTTTGTGNWQVARSTGTGIGTFSDSGLPATSAFFAADFNGDGLTDLGLIDASHTLKVNFHNGFETPPDLAATFTDGFGIYFQPTYVPITQGNYTKYTDAVFPEVDINAPMYVVSQFLASDGKGGTYGNDFYYYGARLHQQGRGFEGFYATRQHDSRNGVYQYSYYQRAFPYTGSVFEQDTVETDGTTYLGSVRSTWTYRTASGLAGTSCAKCYFPFISDSTVYNYEPTNGKGGPFSSSISKAATHYTYDYYGNLTDTTVTTTDTDAATPASPFNGQAWVTEIANTITNDNSAANWCLGRPNLTTTTKTVPGQAAQTRTVAHTIDYANCRATVETVEPNDARLKVTTSFTFATAACGNTSGVSVVGLDKNGAPMPARATTTTYGAHCTFPESVTNALIQTTSTAYNYAFGKPSSTTDPNNIQTGAWLYDNFGRPTKETHADGTYTSSAYVDCVTATCWGLPDLRFLAETWNYTSDGTKHGTTYKYYDGLDRQRYEETYRATGVWTVTVVQYDTLGRKVSADLPYSGCCDNGYHVYSYDIANRMYQDALYQHGGTLYRTIGIGYKGQTVAVTDPNGHTITKVTDVAGKIRQVTDDSSGGTMAGVTKYTFDPFGNLNKIEDANIPSVVSTYTYNIRGFKTGSSDADAGNWTFTPDSLNELVSQTDALTQTTSYVYDLLGRMIQRQELEQPTPTTWTYGTSAAAHEIGRIVHVSKPDTPNAYGEDYTYDGYGRPQTVTYTEDTVAYAFAYTYGIWGSVDTLQYPTSTSGYRFVAKNVYDTWGFLSQVQDNATGSPFWTLGSANDSSLPTSETLGNGVMVTSAYTPYTNEITSRSEGTGGSTNNVQNLAYQWDLAGNLHLRQDQIQGLTEQFTYDSMNRLLNSTLNGTSNLTLTYDAAGNINSKSDVSASAYVYDTIHKHAVKTAGSWGMTYDANGNMVTRAGGTIGWKSYNLPYLISYSGNSTQFNYNANHQRWKQVANYAGTTETTHYVGGLLEVMQRGSGPTEYRHLIPAGSNAAIYTRRSDLTNSTYYATSDHLGSSDLILDSSGNVLSRESFTPFGARRASNWSNTAPSPGDYTVFGNTTRKGFTGHEMLDSVSLVHMGGRVYDPYLGRFTSADSVIQSLAASQSINPYAYAWNDPLRYTDPSGHDIGIWAAVIGIVAAIVTCGAIIAVEAMYGAALTAVSMGAIGGFVGGFVGAMVQTGSLSAAITAGVIGGATGALFAGIGDAAKAGQWGVGERAVAHAAVGCVSTAASGGNCGRGAISAGVSEYLGSQILHGSELAAWGSGEMVAQTAKYALIGGVASSILGGKFADGFTVSAAAYLFNDSMQHRPGRSLTSGEITMAKQVYDDSIDYSQVRIVNGNYIPGQDANTLMTPNGNIYAPSSVYRDDYSSATSVMREAFVHEMAHVLQYQEGVNVRWEGLKIALSGGYSEGKSLATYTPLPGVPYLQQNIEQQAQMWVQLYLERRGLGYVQ